MPKNLICISILAKLVCGSNAQRSLTWWASLGRKRQLPLRRAARLLNKVCGRETPLKVKASCHSCRWLVSLRLHFITSEFSTDLKGIALIGFISNTNRTFLQPKLRWNDLRRLEITSSYTSDAKKKKSLRISLFLKLYCPKSHTNNLWIWKDKIWSSTQNLKFQLPIDVTLCLPQRA